ncbi:hypothetical protein PENSPDRAFT_185240 [Peniophora sp. CONT]|nr:hypothetical protein PENSPDRAFT_185240 [Peniophora sp. CONT]
MEYFSEDHSKLLLSREWLVKVDGDTSTAYLMKFSASFSDQSCVFMVTDTKSVWAEVLNTQRLMRRWQSLNPSTSPVDLPPPEAKREQWIDAIVQCLADSHTSGGMEVGGDGFKWRWDACIVPPNLAAEVLSKHLILPLVSTAHLAFTTKEPLGEMSESELEKAVDRVGRTARRGVDTHLRTTVTRPRLSTTLRRVTALFDFNENLPRIIGEADKPDIRLPTAPQEPELDKSKGKGRVASHNSVSRKTPSHASSPVSALPDVEPMAVDEPNNIVDSDIKGKDKGQAKSESQVSATASSQLQPSAPADEGSDTAPDSDTEPVPPREVPVPAASTTLPVSAPGSPPVKAKPRAPRTVVAPDESSSDSDAKPRSKPTKTPAARRAGNSSSSDSSPPPAKKSKPAPARKPVAVDDSSSDSDGEKRPAGVRRGTRQPIKRGGRRF